MRFGGRKKNTRAGRQRIMFATDLHGSDLVFRKFLNAVAVYEATVAILGGDLTGKRLAPITNHGSRYSVTILDEPLTFETEQELEEVRSRIRNLGHYPVVVTPDELAAMESDPALVERRFEEECQRQVADWMRRAAERLEPLGIPLYVTGGNDDYFSIEAILDESPWITNAEGQVLEIAPGLQMISTGYGNPTPWQCPRDVTEEELAQRIDVMAVRLDGESRAIFNLHVPPYGSGLDRCPKLDTSVSPPKPVTGAEISAGSTAVAAALEQYGPVLSLHGHIHESAGIRELGHTLAINPGSEYGEGILRTAVIDINGEELSSQLLTA